MVVCAVCGHDTPDEAARFCAACGRSLSPVSAAEATSTLGIGTTLDDGDAVAPAVESALVERLAPGTALLVVKRGPSSGARFLLDADVTTAGRHPSSDIFLDDVTVSRRHAQFRRDASAFRVVDVGSLNGTYVNRSRVDDATLVNADEVQIGKYRLVFIASPTGNGS